MRISDWSSDVCSSDLLAGGDLLIENSAFLHERPGDEDDRDNDDQNEYRHGGQGCEVRATMHPAKEAALQGHENNGQRLPPEHRAVIWLQTPSKRNDEQEQLKQITPGVDILISNVYFTKARPMQQVFILMSGKGRQRIQ